MSVCFLRKSSCLLFGGFRVFGQVIGAPAADNAPSSSFITYRLQSSCVRHAPWTHTMYPTEMNKMETSSRSCQTLAENKNYQKTNEYAKVSPPLGTGCCCQRRINHLPPATCNKCRHKTYNLLPVALGDRISANDSLTMERSLFSGVCT